MPTTKIHVRIGFDLTIPMDRTKDYIRYKGAIGYVHSFLKSTIKNGLPEGYQVDKYLIDTYPVEDS